MSRRIRSDSLIFHCFSRINGRMHLLDDPAVKDFMVRLLYRQAAWSSIEVFSFCIMNNHFHILLKEVPVEALSQADWEEKVRAYYSANAAQLRIGRVLALRKGGEDAQADALIERDRRRMGNVSAFMREFKRMFSLWYNRRTGRDGTLWNDRFKSVAVQNVSEALLTMAAYIDLNPIRAGITTEAEAYRWSTYGAACGGLKSAQASLRRLYKAIWDSHPAKGWATTQEWFKRVLCSEGIPGRDPNTGAVTRAGLSMEVIEKVLNGKDGTLSGKLSWGQAMRCRMRYLSDGVAIGSAEYVKEVFRKNRSAFSEGRGEPEGAPFRKIAGVGLRSLRELRGGVARTP